jgi:Mrp family chromosome partitioning ATPase
MVSKEDILEILKNVMDPELGMDIVTLGMVREAHVEGSAVSVIIALTSDTCPLGERIRKDIEESIKSLEGVSSVNVEMVVMNEAERNRIIEILKANKKEQLLPEKFPKKQIKRVVAILSGKGGVGKSSVTSMLAVELSKRSLKVGILDADITGPSIPKIFGVSAAPFVLEGKIIPSVSESGIKIISMNLLVGQEEAPIIWRGPLISSAIRQFFIDVDWAELDYLLVDLPPGTSDAQLTVLQLLPVDGIIVVTSPQELVGVIVAKAVQMTKMLSIPVLGVIENMTTVKCPHCGLTFPIFGESKGQLLADKINTKFLGALPIDPELSKACDEGKIEYYSSDAFKAIAEKLLY